MEEDPLRFDTLESKHSPLYLGYIVAVSVVIVAGIVVLFLAYPDSIQTIGTILTVLFTLGLIAWASILYSNKQSKRNLKLQRFAKENGFTFSANAHDFFQLDRGEAPREVAARFPRDERLLLLREDMKTDFVLQGTYANVDFAIGILQRYWRMSDGKTAITFYGALKITSKSSRDTSLDFAHMIGIQKTNHILKHKEEEILSELLDSASFEKLKPSSLSSARYELFSKDFNNGENDIDNIVATIPVDATYNIEILDSSLYLVAVDGLDLTKDGCKKLFDQIERMSAILERRS